MSSVHMADAYGRTGSSSQYFFQSCALLQALSLPPASKRLSCVWLWNQTTPTFPFNYRLSEIAWKPVCSVHLIHLYLLTGHFDKLKSHTHSCTVTLRIGPVMCKFGSIWSYVLYNILAQFWFKCGERFKWLGFPKCITDSWDRLNHWCDWTEKNPG